MKSNYYISIKKVEEKDLGRKDGIKNGFIFSFTYEQKFIKEIKIKRNLSNVEIRRLLKNLYKEKHNVKNVSFGKTEESDIMKDITDTIENDGIYLIKNKDIILDSCDKNNDIRPKNTFKKAGIIATGALIAGLSTFGIIKLVNANKDDSDNNEEAIEEAIEEIIETSIEDDSDNNEEAIEEIIETSIEDNTNQNETVIDKTSLEETSVDEPYINETTEYSFIPETDIIETTVDSSETLNNVQVFDIDYNINNFNSNTDALYSMFNNRYAEYGEFFEKYGEQYGIDPALLCAISCQENYGKQIRQGNGGYGLMQVIPWWNNISLEVFNYNTNQNETVTFNCDNYQSIETNEITLENAEAGIKAGSAIFQESLRVIYTINENLSNRYTPEQCVILAIKNYNNSSVGEIMKQSSNFEECLKKINTIGSGDKDYIKNVLKFIPDGTTLTVCNKDHEPVNIIIDNTQVDSYSAPSNAKKI